MKKKVIGLRVEHEVKLNHPIEIDLDNLENISKELRNTTDEIFVGVDNLMHDLGHDHKCASAVHIYEDED